MEREVSEFHAELEEQLGAGLWELSIMYEGQLPE